jgi:hypothetical protein
MEALFNSENISFCTIQKIDGSYQNVLDDKVLYVFSNDQCILKLNRDDIVNMLSVLDIDKNSFNKFSVY